MPDAGATTDAMLGYECIDPWASALDVLSDCMGDWGSAYDNHNASTGVYEIRCRYYDPATLDCISENWWVGLDDGRCVLPAWTGDCTGSDTATTRGRDDLGLAL